MFPRAHSRISGDLLLFTAKFGSIAAPTYIAFDAHHRYVMDILHVVPQPGHHLITHLREQSAYLIAGQLALKGLPKRKLNYYFRLGFFFTGHQVPPVQRSITDFSI